MSNPFNQPDDNLDMFSRRIEADQAEEEATKPYFEQMDIEAWVDRWFRLRIRREQRGES